MRILPGFFTGLICMVGAESKMGSAEIPTQQKNGDYPVGSLEDLNVITALLDLLAALSGGSSE